jgi:hypothetical protein
MDFAAHAGQIAKALLGQPNEALSTKRQLRFGSNGSLAIEISGAKTGTWFDHEHKTGGGLLDLIERERKCSRADALTWLSSIGVELGARGNGAAQQQQRRVAVYIYRDETGEPLFAVTRWAPIKTFSQGRHDPATGQFIETKGAMRGVRLVPYRLPELLASSGRVFVCEGEKDCDRLAGLGLAATTNPGGAGKWPASFSKHFAGRDVVVLPDHDQAGRDHAEDVVAKLRGSAASVRILELPALLAKQDVSNWLDAGYTVAQLEALLAEPENLEGGPPLTSAVHAHLHTLPRLAENRDILSALDRALGLCKVVGERRNAKLIYLALTSRLLSEPVSLALKGVSSSGKSYTLEAVLRFVPKEAVISMTAMSERALIYMDEEFAHRTMVLFEAVALREQREKTESNLTAYFVRSLLSEGRISYPVTVRSEGGWTTKTITKDGPTNIVLTTTSISLHGENETRMLSLPTDDTADQTRAILLELASERTETVDFTAWHDLQHWLAGAEHRVVIPYARRLAESIPPVAVRLRRDFRAILSLIRTHAILHQCTRDRDDRARIIATAGDYLQIRELVADLVADGVGATVSATVRETVEAVRDHDGITVSSVAERLGIDRSAAQRRLSTARARGFLKNLEEKRGRLARYAVGEPMPEELVLLPLDLDEAVHAQPATNTHPCTPAQPLKTKDNSGGCAAVHGQPGKRGMSDGSFTGKSPGHDDESAGPGAESEGLADPQRRVAMSTGRRSGMGFLRDAEGLAGPDVETGGSGDEGGHSNVAACCHCGQPIRSAEPSIHRDDGQLIHQACFAASFGARR